MSRQKQYPVTLNFIKERSELTNEIFIRECPHDGAFIGVTALEGSFLCDFPGEVFSKIEIGERLTVVSDASSNLALPTLNVFRADGTPLGKLPFAAAILPNILITRGVAVWCHAEAKQFNAGLLEIGVSIYCEKY